MKHQLSKLLVISSLVILAGNAQAANPQAHIDGYKQQGVSQIDIDKGREVFNSTVDGRSCTTCHGSNLKLSGKHEKTGKPIDPMALSVNAERYQDSKKIEKWFLRNCKWTFNRTCTVQEKADMLSWLITQ